MIDNLHDTPVSRRFVSTTVDKALLLHTAGDTAQAIALLTDLLTWYPGNDQLLYHLGRLHLDTDHCKEAVSLLLSIPEQSPYFHDALFITGITLAEKRDLKAAADTFCRLLLLDSYHVEGHNNLALCLMELGRPEEAQQHFAAAIRLAPERAEAYNNFGNLFVRYWKLAEAEKMYRMAIEIKPDYAGAYSNLGRIANYEGRIDDALALFTQALDLNPGFRTAADNLLFILNNSDHHTPEQISHEHFRLSRLYPGSARPHQQFARRGSKIRIGYVSPDFKSHSVGFFIEPVLQNHSHDEFEIFCYDQATVPDETTARMKSYGWSWQPVFGLTDSELAEQISADGIDILVDLAGHSEENRLGAFALRPAPIQVTWLGYPNTTGLKQIDFRITDVLADPPGMTEHLHSEILIRLPHSFLCYAAPFSAQKNDNLLDDEIVFCCFNNYPKLSDATLDMWGLILAQVPGSRLFLKSGPLGDKGVRERIIARCTARGIDNSRLMISSFTISREEHLQLYERCHIALDSFPYNGTTTTCEALWMGVPVVTRAGNHHAARVGLSILTYAGLPELVATTMEQYVVIAVKLAQNRSRLLQYRHLLRNKLAASPIMNARSFTYDLERSYLWMVEKQRGH